MSLYKGKSDSGLFHIGSFVLGSPNEFFTDTTSAYLLYGLGPLETSAVTPGIICEAYKKETGSAANLWAKWSAHCEGGFQLQILALVTPQRFLCFENVKMWGWISKEFRDLWYLFGQKSKGCLDLWSSQWEIAHWGALIRTWPGKQSKRRRTKGHSFSSEVSVIDKRHGCPHRRRRPPPASDLSLVSCVQECGSWAA